jgi:hypothetical protein
MVLVQLSTKGHRSETLVQIFLINLNSLH